MTTSISGEDEDGAAGKRIQRQPRGGLPDRRLYRQDIPASITPANGICRPRPPSACTAAWAATPFRRALRNSAAYPTGTTGRNGYFLCDRGRYGYEFVNGEQRLRSALAGSRGTVPLSPLPATKRSGGRPRCVRKRRESSASVRRGHRSKAEFHACGACRAGRLLQWPVAQRRRPHGRRCRRHPHDRLRQASMRDAAAADAVFVLGEDLLNTAPMLGFALRQAMVRRDNGP